MARLTWERKTGGDPLPAELRLDSGVYPGGAGYPAPPSNRLFLGDNLAVMAALLPAYEGRLDLIYADPPFFTNRSFKARIGRGEDSRKPQDWRLAHGYADAWASLDEYLDMLYPRLAMMHRLLAPTGTLYLHLDWHASAYARLLLDEIFGAERLLNEIAWVYHGPSPIRTAFNRKHDTLLVYTKSDPYTFNVDAVRQPYDPTTVKTFNSSPKAGFGKVPDLARGKVPEDWWYFPVVARLHNERTGYPTQKPEALLERILLASSNPGGLVADFFCGSGSFPAVAARLGRRWLAADAAWRAVQTTRSRLAGAGAGAFSLEMQTGFAPQVTETAPIAWDGSGPVQLSAGRSVDIDYWEIDPDWNGEVFNSLAQARRPLRLAHIQTALALPPASPARNPWARLASAVGGLEMAQILRTSGI